MCNPTRQKCPLFRKSLLPSDLQQKPNNHGANPRGANPGCFRLLGAGTLKLSLACLSCLIYYVHLGKAVCPTWTFNGGLPGSCRWGLPGSCLTIPGLHRSASSGSNERKPMLPPWPQGLHSGHFCSSCTLLPLSVSTCLISWLWKPSSLISMLCNVTFSLRTFLKDQFLSHHAAPLSQPSALTFHHGTSHGLDLPYVLLIIFGSF